MNAQTVGEPSSIDRSTTISVVLAVKNEARHLRAAVEAVQAQTGVEIADIAIAIAPSSDDTVTIARDLAESDPRIVVLDNPDSWVSHGLNRAIAATTGDIVVRVDGHCELAPDYVTTAAATMARTGASVVGGIQRAIGTAPTQRAIAAAMTSPLGVGDAKFHYGGAEGPTDTVFLGVFRRDALEAVGGFNETLLRNQDYDLNWRIRQSGGVVWFDPNLAVDYLPRATLGGLWRQYVDYGWWKQIMLRDNPASLKARQMAAPVLVAGLTGSAVAAAATRRPWILLPWLGYGAALVAGAAAAKNQPLATRLRLPAVFATMHLAWGSGFWASLLLRKKSTS